MSNARNLANLLGTNTTVPMAKQPAGSVLQCVTTNYPDDFWIFIRVLQIAHRIMASWKLQQV